MGTYWNENDEEGEIRSHRIVYPYLADMPGQNTDGGNEGRPERNRDEGKMCRAERNRDEEKARRAEQYRGEEKARRPEQDKGGGKTRSPEQNRDKGKAHRPERENMRPLRVRKRHRKRRRALLAAAGILLAAGAAVWVCAHRDVRTVSGGRIRIWDFGSVNEEPGQEADLLMLVNKDHPLPEGYEPRLHWLKNKSCAVAEEMYDALSAMLSAGTDEGLSFVVASGYRDRVLQEELLEEDIAASMESEGLTWQQAYEKETQETMPPGCSEHETGLAADIVSLDYQVLDEQQELTAECQWLQKNCSRFGFILRYPRGKEEITGVDYESWHFRFVGAEAAQEIMSRGITLEEYLGKEV